ncbi:hypothetical protein BC830DRAFT_231182 [Chytriomyces sp. MP71]|nr:hypothetical protein BC830DRAFT_231182 [Chytriomyces sp. MP71]
MPLLSPRLQIDATQPLQEAVLVTPPEPLQQGTTKTESILSHVSSVRKPIGTAASSPLLETPASNMGSPPGTGDAIPLEPAAIVLNLKRAASPAPSEMSDFEAPIDPMIFAKPVPVCGSVRLLAAATPMKRKRGRPPKKRPSPSKDNAAEDVVAAPSSDSPRQERVKRRRRNLVRDSDSGETGGEEVGSGVKEEMDGSESESLKVGGKRSRWLLKRSASQCAHSQESKRMRFSESELSEDEVSEEEASDLSTTDLDESEEEVKAVSPVAHRPKTRAKRAVNYAEDDYSSADAESMSYSSESNGPTTVHGSDSEVDEGLKLAPNTHTVCALPRTSTQQPTTASKPPLHPNSNALPASLFPRFPERVQIPLPTKILAPATILPPASQPNPIIAPTRASAPPIHFPHRMEFFPQQRATYEPPGRSLSQPQAHLRGPHHPHQPPIVFARVPTRLGDYAPPQQRPHVLPFLQQQQQGAFSTLAQASHLPPQRHPSYSTASYIGYSPQVHPHQGYPQHEMSYAGARAQNPQAAPLVRPGAYQPFVGASSVSLPQQFSHQQQERHQQHQQQ